MTIDITPHCDAATYAPRYKRVRDVVDGEYKLKQRDLNNITALTKSASIPSPSYLRYINPTDKSRAVRAVAGPSNDDPRGPHKPGSGVHDLLTYQGILPSVGSWRGPPGLMRGIRKPAGAPATGGEQDDGDTANQKTGEHR